MTHPAPFGPDAAALPTIADLHAARARIGAHVRRTEILRDDTLDAETGATLFFKCENLQPPGSFKVRGACNAVLGLSEGQAAHGVATHSSGNHAAALAYAAGRRGIPCHVVMPETAPRAKRARALAYGARITECAPSTAAREATLADLVAATGAEAVHPYDDIRVIAGQASCAMELVEQVPGLDVVIAPVGGGGLIAGTCLALADLAPCVAVYAAEPAQADDAARSFRAGRLVQGADAPVTVADGLKAPIRERTWQVIARHVTDISTATEAEIVEAMRLSWDRLKQTIEPSCAVPLAVIRARPEVFAGKRVGVILTGGNVDLDRLPWME